MKRIVTIDDATGNILSEWSGGTDQALPPAPGGQARIDVSASPDGSYSGKRWNGIAFEVIPPAPVRVLSRLDFARRFTLAEEASIDALADTNRAVKAWMRRLSLADSVNLDRADVAAGLAYLKSVGIPSVWPDGATADRRIAEIRE
ncbi:MAG: hypothetical protein A3J29_06220 [Acidobacteria bacterium RIFCSPLOWO2_12_FULL_67_14b]|nr:MAG: hypothetical protein A3J29_06220 [Acidobacteria bacterium RIFCSPLOWO2_12_FULL_67_14b]